MCLFSAGLCGAALLAHSSYRKLNEVCITIPADEFSMTPVQMTCPHTVINVSLTMAIYDDTNKLLIDFSSH